LHYTSSGYLFISPQDDCNMVVDEMLATGYNEEFCIANSFAPDFVARLMEAGFLIMSTDAAAENKAPFYLVLPKLHIERSALFFENLRVKKSIRKLLPLYELRADAEFNVIIDRCVEKWGEAWLTPPLVDCIKKIRLAAPHPQILSPTANAYPASFGLYREGKLVAGEFGVVCGNVYTSYSGYYEEPNSGTVQIILAARYLQDNGFSFFDLGMPLKYKNALGAVDILPERFVQLFRKGVDN